MYRRGYFHQFLDPEGWQQEEYPETDIYHLPVERAKDADGNEIYITVSGPAGDIRAMVWRIMVGRIPLLLLDTNLRENSQEIRDITARLYSADPKIRLAQEVLLGIGGMRALEAMDIYPKLCHMNEGHCAFASLERLAQIASTYKVDLDVAREITVRTTIFTTHTPVAAGHDEFPADLVKSYLTPLKDRLNTSVNEILSWGQPSGTGADSDLSMFVLGLRMAQYCNGVSKLHGHTARRMWGHVWPGKPVDEIPITHITNGVHIPSWISIENSLLFERYIGPEWYMKTRDDSVLKRIDDIYDEELWRAHEMSRSRLIRVCRTLMQKQYRRRNASKAIMKEVETVLDQDVLTIGFARRFATYKRANLLLHDRDRFEAILASTEQPVQFIFAGKAHPKDNDGKNLIKNLIQYSRNPNIRHKIIFLEDYDINIARHLLQGVDVWLYEACGTSGIKAAANGVLNVSILDGWWCEGYADENGWRIGNGEEYEDWDYQDAVESQALYNLLENDVIPCFYDRQNGNFPERWLKKMKSSMKMAMQNFCSHRMIRKYEALFYRPAAERLKAIVADGAEEAKQLNALKGRLSTHWEEILVGGPVKDNEGPFRVGESFHVTTEVFIGDLLPEEVEVELYYGYMKSVDILDAGHLEKMSVEMEFGDGRYKYGCVLSCDVAGRYGFTARVIPSGDDMIKNLPGFLTWA